MELKEFIENLAEQFDDTDISEIQADTEFQALDEWSSLTAMSIIAMVKTQYGKTITGREIRKCSTVEELFDLVKSL
ncbi:MAG: acyl carrier protein [Muribaculaceae bacterium]